jgi:hypothetical protein
MHDQLNRCRAKAEDCERHALTAIDLVIKLRHVNLALEWHELAKEIGMFEGRRSKSV